MADESANSRLTKVEVLVESFNDKLDTHTKNIDTYIGSMSKMVEGHIAESRENQRSMMKITSDLYSLQRRADDKLDATEKGLSDRINANDKALFGIDSKYVGMAEFEDLKVKHNDLKDRYNISKIKVVTVGTVLTTVGTFIMNSKDILSSIKRFVLED